MYHTTCIDDTRYGVVFPSALVATATRRSSTNLRRTCNIGTIPGLLADRPTIPRNDTLSTQTIKDPTSILMSSRNTNEDSIIATLDQVQGHHGVPIGDYADYAAYCTRKLRRLRQKAPALLSHAAKYAPKETKVRRHAYCPRDWDGEQKEDAAILVWYFLFQAERAWAKAMWQPQKSRRYLRTAVTWANRLEEYTGRTATPTSQSNEAHGYAAWMRGNLALDKKAYATALSEYQAVEQAWTAERVETTVRPLVRYCQYEVGDETVVEPSTSATATTTTEPKIRIEFRGETVALDEEDTTATSNSRLAIAYLKMEERLQVADPATLSEAELETLLSDLDDALALVPPSMMVVRDYFIFAKRKYWQFLQLGYRFSSTEAAAASVTLYRALQANAQAMVDLIADDVDDDDDGLWAAAHVLWFRAAACRHLVAMYDNNDPQEALTLVQHAAQLCATALEELAACGVDTTAVETLADEIAVEQCRAEAQVVLALSSSSNTDALLPATGPLWLHLRNGRYAGTPPWVEAGPLSIPIPAKGVMFDLAWPYIAASTEGLQPPQQVKQSSWSSWFS